MKVAILGYGVEGRVAYDYWSILGNDVTIFDDHPVDAPEGAKFQLGPDWQLEGFDLVVRSPGIRPERIPDGIKSTSVVQEFIDKCPAPIIGVTGTKGKGTTASLIAKMLEAGGKTVHLGGNIGRPALDFLDQVKPDDWVVLELSSFQLIDVTSSPHIAVCLMIVPEHLNWHQDMSEYTRAKGNIFKFQQPDDLAIYNAKNQYSAEIAQLSSGVKLPYLGKSGAYIDGGQIYFKGQLICPVDAVGLIGPHNLENICAAVAASYDIVGETAPIARAIKEFKGLEHRLEQVATIDDLSFIDDSFSTTPETAIAAINSFAQPKVLILGGSDKGSDYADLANVIARSNIRKIILIGSTGHPEHKTATPNIEASLKASGVENYVSLVQASPISMDEILNTARSEAQAGDVVLLSPACASFDLFTGYKDRGDQFKTSVQQSSK